MTPAADEASIRAALSAGMAHHDAGRLAEAEAVYRAVLRITPTRPEALVLLADLAHRAGRLDDALGLVDAAIAASPGVAQFHNKRGLVLEGAGRAREAEAAYRRALHGRPDYADAHFNLGNALASQGRFDEALGAFRAAVALDERPVFRAQLARCLAHAHPDAADADVRALAARALREAWLRPADLARPAIALVLADPAHAHAIGAALRAWPEALPARELFAQGGLAALARDALLAALLENAQVCDRRLERLLTLARRALLDAAFDRDDARARDEPGLAFACALARQCFLNDYVFGCDAQELERARALAARIDEDLRGEVQPPALGIAIVASYLPLHGLPCAAALAARTWHEPLAQLVVQQVREPAAERELRAAIPRLNAPGDPVSLRVQRQYEENPYPRWTKLPAAEPATLEAHLRRQFPHLALAGPIPDARILVAGCGTGQESVDLAQTFPHARVLAIDLSMASLGYAARKAREAGLANLEHAQADILGLGSVAERFDAISCVGVLHHLRDPLEGWRALLARLRPGGFMQVGLYSETGRRDLAPARHLIAERGLTATPEGIRRLRRALLDSGDFPRLALLRDLYGMNECRDLLFHEQEHRFTLPQVRSMLATLGVELVGMVVDAAVRLLYAQRFPADRELRDLEAWHAFEGEVPDTFAGMYLFWVRKGGGA